MKIEWYHNVIIGLAFIIFALCFFPQTKVGFWESAGIIMACLGLYFVAFGHGRKVKK